jgi:hypothetical protein
MENNYIEDIAKLLVATYARTFLRRMFEGTEVNENWRRPYNEELMQVFGELSSGTTKSQIVELCRNRC